MTAPDRAEHGSQRHPPPDDHSLDDQVRRYREARRRAKARSTVRSRTEQEELVHDALMWAPYGRVPTDEIFAKYGIARDEFVTRLRHALDVVPIDRCSVVQLANIYRWSQVWSSQLD